ncbi:MAG: D-TA family PLP-dependent enzyme [Gemmataceae bacterium]|nr:D-TA family PLP-dependent enzyme [Gemmataceae bacterium]
MHPHYAIANTSTIFSPALLFYKDLIRRNLARCLEIAGSPERLRPHVKTHKTREIVRLELDSGIRKHKCATIAEAEMLAGCGVPDVLLAYNLVGPNCGRMARLAGAYPGCRFSVLADHPAGARALSETLAQAGQSVDVLLDLDVGQHRTGIAPGDPLTQPSPPAGGEGRVRGDEAVALYELIAHLPGLRPGGLHVYDGHNHQGPYSEREAAVRQQLGPVLALRERLEKKGLPVPRLVLGGTPTFPVFARMDLPGQECAPGTCVLHDHGYGSRFADLEGFTPAALLLTRVISRPTAQRVTFDLGYKAVASDPPAGKRLVLLDVPEYEAVLQNEEHLVIETPAADRFQPGDTAFAVPTHICPTCAMHRQAYVVEGGLVTGTWEIVARDRVLTV